MMVLIFNYVEEYFKKNNVEYSYGDVIELTSYLFGSLVCYDLIYNKLKIKLIQ